MAACASGLVYVLLERWTSPFYYQRPLPLPLALPFLGRVVQGSPDIARHRFCWLARGCIHASNVFVSVVDFLKATPFLGGELRWLCPQTSEEDEGYVIVEEAGK